MKERPPTLKEIQEFLGRPLTTEERREYANV